ncbi:dynein heavy chain 2 [Scenedesmus sp. NREL 46B-D3]|nr:dynein heavy chain 2 [Scenedesmus sp. NREL 46B-D3]
MWGQLCLLQGKVQEQQQQQQQGVQVDASSKSISSTVEEADNDEACHAHLLPKVFVPFVTKPGDTPRQVQIQRKRRLYACQSIAELVAQEGLDLQQLFSQPEEHWEQLEVFDDITFESRNHEQWVPRIPGIPKAEAKVAGRTHGGSISWVDSLVLDYDSSRNRYLVQLQASGSANCHSPTAGQQQQQQPGRQQKSPCSSSGSSSRVPFWVPRVQLCFAAEDPRMYAKRFAAAHAFLTAADVQLAYELCIDSMPVDDVPQLSTEQVNRVLNFALNSKKLKDRLMDTSSLINEANLEHARAMNKVALRALTAAAAGTASGAAVAAAGSGEQLLPFAVPPPVPAKPVPAKGTVEVAAAAYDFREQLSEFSFKTLLTKPEVIFALGKIRLESSKVVKMCLFNTYSSKSLRLEEFEQVQIAATDAVANHLRDNWAASIKNIIKMSFKDVGKGWYNLAESNFEAYRFSKLRRLLGLVRLSMQDSLRYLAEGSMAKFVGFMQVSTAVITAAIEASMPCPGRSDKLITDVVDVVSTSQIDIDCKDLSRKAPLLLTELVVAPEGASFTYSTPISSMHSKVVAVFDRAITKLQGLSQLEPAIMDLLSWPSVPLLNAVHLQEEVTVRARDAVSGCLLASLQPLCCYLAKYAAYEPLLTMSVEAYVDVLAAKGTELGLADISREVASHSAELAHMEEHLLPTVNLGLVQVNCMKVREALLRKKEKLVCMLKTLVARVPRSMLAATSSKFSELERQLKAKASSIEEVDQQRNFISELPAKMASLVAEVEVAQPWYAALESMRYLLPEEDAKDKLAGQSWQVKLLRQADRSLELLDGDEAKYADELTTQQEAFVSTINNLAASLAAAQQHSDVSKVDTVAKVVADLEQQLRAAEKEAAVLNAREGLLGRAATDYSQIKQLSDVFDPYLQFWSTAGTWKANQKAWMSGPLEDLNGEAVEKDVALAHKVLYKMGKVFAARGLEQMAANADTLRQQVEDFKGMVPLVQGLRNPGMRIRHWDSLSSELALDLHPDKAYTLDMALKQGLLGHLEVLSRTADVASKEYSIEQALDKLQHEWEGAELGVLEYRDTGTHIIKLEEAMGQQLEDHIVMLQSMGFSPYKKPFEDRLAKWDTMLNLVSEVLEQWIALQRTWMYLEPIFGSEDIMQQLPLEGKRFATVDRSWRKTLDAAKRSPGLLKMCGSQKLLNQFTESNKLLDSVQKGLADYLETKRLAFARFFFLSNDELLQILSQAKNPLAVQPHLRKCFEAVASLDFGPDLAITAMNSAEKEKVPFDKPMMPAGNVEVWLGEVERRMKASIRSQVVAAMHAYVSRPRTSWVREWPAMVVLAAFLERCTADLMDLTDLVQGQLSEAQHLTLGALITMDVHARDVVQELVDADLKRVTDFEWVSRLRYYWRDDVVVDMAQASIAYGYEYLGNSPRLVITPLTDRCYMTLMTAMHLNLGGAPAGPAGTGKTETTKDLAKALAKQCVVFNCSDGLDYLAMVGQIFKGLASSGSWACFDEFNRIDLEVLSVIAQQILTIQLAIQAKHKRFIFEDTEIDLNPACAVYITMNPGYAGRSELPDNLKALFRPCAMMVPDYALIAEISLYSYGYRSAKGLARKMVATFKLCSEQLSSQDHYDYGMRAVKSVITAAGNLKPLRDVNVPKFLRHDLPLFAGIITDLFPGVAPPKVDYGAMLSALKAACGDLGVQAVEPFLAKVIQLYETTLVRHGLMLVGPTMAGKTCCYRALAKAMSTLQAAGEVSYEKVRTAVLNPKAITMGQLYGQFDDNTHEWTDGVLACYMREFAQDTSPDKKWLLFDGPVDALWIENMNTVLDDNKKLCLVSGEIITLSPQMTMMFEVEDLAVASPATVSRCGMVYMEPDALGVDPLLASWLVRLPAAVKPHQQVLSALFNAVVPDALQLVRKQLRETVATTNHNLVMSCFNLMDAMLKPYVGQEGLPPAASTLEQLPHVLPSLMLFAITWSLGASCDKAGRAVFDSFLRKQVASLAAVAGSAPDGDAAALQLPDGALMPSAASVYEWCYDRQAGVWVPWMDTMPEFQCDPNKPFAQIIVPTADTVCYTFLVDALLAAGKHVLCVGETGTGKTLSLSAKLLEGMPPEVQPLFMTFSARTSANQTQDIIDSKMDKRRKGVFGPPAGKRCVVFVDDLNMPQRERYFAQPPLELLRQWFDHGGWYDRKPPCAFKSVVTRSFFTEFSDDSLQRIFGTILGAYFRRHFVEAVGGLTQKLVAGTVELYNAIRTELLPTPSKSHYTFNLRDMSKVVQGLMRADPKTTSTPEQILALWLHENSRVFEDRLTCSEDHAWFRQHQAELLRKHFDLDYGQWCPRSGWCMETTWCREQSQRWGGRAVYGQVQDMPSLVRLVESYLEDYNSTSTSPMKLVLFLDAIEHVSRICRIIRQPLGNALLLGVGGSGRQSLARLAAFMCDYEVAQIEIAKGYGNNEWREAGLEGHDTVFLFNDTQIVQEGFLEDLNNILNAGDVPNLFGPDDMEAIAAGVRPAMVAAGLPINKMTIYSYFINRVRCCLHLVLCFSPVGEAFRQRLRMFPSLVNCTTIDWFSEWPVEALTSVARSFCADMDLGQRSSGDTGADAGGSLMDGVLAACVHIHQSVEAKSKQYYQELRRYNYVTPTSYLELLGTFLKLLGGKRAEVSEAKKRLAGGLDKLTSTAAQVEVMQRELQELQPVLAATAKEVEDMMVVIAHDKEEAAETKKMVQQQEREANEQAAAAKAIADDAQRDLDAALPALDAAVASLKNLSRNDVVEVRSLQNPPAGVKLVMEATCIMFDEKPKMKDDPNKMGKKIPDYWEASKKLLSDATKFLESLLSYDKDNIPEAVIARVEPYINSEEFTPEAVARVSKACTSICMWVRAMHLYHTVALGVAPKRAALAAAQESLDKTLAELASAQARLLAVQDKIAALEAQFEEATAKKASLAAQVADCQVKLQRADKLIGGLSGERTRWSATVEQLQQDLDNLVGDVVLAAGAIAYSGPFVPSYRASLLADWTAKLVEVGLPHSPHANLIKTLADPVQIRAWTIAGLPTDTVSVENAIIISKARRWPLMVDPQGQANRWVKAMELAAGLEVVQTSYKDFLRTLENGIRFGRPVLLEDLGEGSLDAALEPLLLRSTFKQGGSEVIKLGDNIVPYHQDFKFYMTTKVRNPHYPPEVSVKVSLLNFFVTPDGLEDQLLGAAVTQERPDLANLKSALVVSNAKMKAELAALEGRILGLLSASSGNILDDEELINTLAQAKVTSNEVSARVAQAEATEKEIDDTREQYRPVAVRASLLFFAISELAAAADVAERGELLNQHFTYSLYVNVCRSLFERHKLLFSFILTMKIMQHAGSVDAAEWRFLLAGPVSAASNWLTDKSWSELLGLAQLPTYAGLAQHVMSELAHYKSIFDSNQPAHAFQKLLLLRCLRPDRVLAGVQDFVAVQLGSRFIEPPPFDLAACFRESSPTTPLVFVLSPGADPMADLLKLAEELKFSRKFEKVSLGQGQGPKAEKLLEVGMERGLWVCLQNCHLAISWMPALERIVQNIHPDKVHKDFRLWLTSMPSPAFPVSILQNGVKMTLEPPAGLKANMMRQYNRFTEQYLAASSKPLEWRRLLFGLCLFHAVVQDRRKFGPLGWNIRYDFTDGDLNVSLAQLQEYLDSYETPPFRVLQFLFTEINYGGRVTDDKDRRLINTLISTFCAPRVLQEGCAFSPCGTYAVPGCETAAQFCDIIRGFPLVPSPEIFGLHDNADITCQQAETYELLGTLLSLQPRSSSGSGGAGNSQEAVVRRVAQDILDKLPAPFDVESISTAYPTTYMESMNTVLAQEAIRYNALLDVIDSSLRAALKALKGLVVMSPDLEEVVNSLLDNQVPESWAARAYPSLKPLAGWVADLAARLAFIQAWVADGTPAVYWISGFFFPQAFLTGTLQNYARKNALRIDTVSFSFQVMDDLVGGSSCGSGPEDGCYIRGLFMEGAHWDGQQHQLAESRPKELFTEMPVVWLKPQQHRTKPEAATYDCPVYKTVTRAGTLSTTGHSTNFIMMLELGTAVEPSHWINRGVALFTALPF